MEKKKLKNNTTEEFQQELTEFSGESVEEDFRKYVYGKKE
jgi:hypothetical protein